MNTLAAAVPCVLQPALVFATPPRPPLHKGNLGTSPVFNDRTWPRRLCRGVCAHVRRRRRADEPTTISGMRTGSRPTEGGLMRGAQETGADWTTDLIVSADRHGRAHEYAEAYSRSPLQVKVAARTAGMLQVRRLLPVCVLPPRTAPSVCERSVPITLRFSSCCWCTAGCLMRAGDLARGCAPPGRGSHTASTPACWRGSRALPGRLLRP